jgi:hypothetical protein
MSSVCSVPPGPEVVPISWSVGVDVITGDSLADALKDADAIIDVTAGPSSEQRAATEFFTTAAGNLQQAGERADVARYVVVSIIGIEKSTGGYGSAKLAHEQAVLAGPMPARILRVAQFHELVGVLMEMGRHGDVALLWLPVIRVVRSRRRLAPVLAVVVTTITAALALLLLASTEYGAQIFPPLWGILAFLPPAAGAFAVALLRHSPAQ